MEGYWSLKIRRAVVMAADTLGDKKIDNIPYVFLNMGTALIFALLKKPQEMITASILQGTLTNSQLNPERIKTEFGSNVLMDVLIHTDPYWPMFWKDENFRVFPELQGYSIERIFRALKMGALAHGQQRRKEKNILFFCHPLMVALLLALLRANEYQIIAGILHDTLEDTKLPVESIGDAFGSDVLHIVLAGTEDKTQSWEDRKQQTIQRLYEADLDVKVDICADKLDNLQSTYDVLIAEGCNNPEAIKNAEVWQYFARGYESQKWYYTNVVLALFHGIEKIAKLPNIFGTLMRLTENIFGEKIIKDEALRALVPSRH